MPLIILTLDMFLYVALSPAHKASISNFRLWISLILMLLSASNNAVFADIMRPTILSLLVIFYLSLDCVRERCGLQEVPKRVHVQYGRNEFWRVTVNDTFFCYVEDSCCSKLQSTPLNIAASADCDKLWPIKVAYYLESIVGVFAGDYKYPISVRSSPFVQLLI